MVNKDEYTATQSPMSESPHSQQQPSKPEPDATDAEPTENTQSLTITCGPASLFRGCTPEERQDLAHDYEPDVYFITGTDASYHSAKQLEYELPGSTPAMYPGNAQSGDGRIVTINGIDIIACPNMSMLQEIRQYEQSGQIDTDTETIILSNFLSIELSMDDLEASMKNLQTYKDYLQPDALDGSYTHVSGMIDAGYCREWDGMLVRGAGLNPDSHSTKFTTLNVTTDGLVHTDTIDNGQLGIKSISGIGPTTAQRLRENGFTTIDAIANADLADLKAVKGIGDTKAKNMTQSAQATDEGRVILTTDEPFPARNPIFIDIETDGLNPTCIWLIGVRDGVNGDHMSFITTDPDKPGKAVESFMMWYAANGKGRTLLAWNGWGFDFPHLREHIQRHCPQYLDDWEQASKRDPLRWARDLDNAILPGRTNKLEHVASALDWDGHNTELSGAEVARQFRAWMQNPCPATELDWEQHKRYCADDCHALEIIYNAIISENRMLNTDPAPDQQRLDEETTQGSLFDNYESS